jgi:FixJ family two-component response regulator
MEAPLVSIVDDDALFRGATETLVKALGFRTCAFPSAESFLQSPFMLETRCLILDIHMPEMSGLELQDHLSDLGLAIPIIFVTGYSNEASRAQALNAGAVCFLRKSVDLQGQRLADCIQVALGPPGHE